ncbi:MAG: phosphatase PAP2 family protein [Leptolyngbya sp. SIOISBB]|nr:phosphatase PAP2 family protein [Leptolyngbya sp. SIOISBB]
MRRFKSWQRLGALFESGWQLIRRHYQALLVLFVGVLLPLQIFAELAGEVWEKEGLAWDQPILLWLRETASPQLDRFAVVLTQFGVYWGVFPLALIIGLVLLGQRRWRSLTYYSLTLIGSMLINVTVKSLAARSRPALWDSPAPELDYSFPSGHAMSSMTFIAALVILLRGSRWQWLVTLLGGIFVLAIGWTRLYLGVHYPSDIVAGWAASIGWAVGVALVIRPYAHPQRARHQDPV